MSRNYKTNYKMGDFMVHSSGSTIYDISRTYAEANNDKLEHVAQLRSRTGAGADYDFFIEPIKDKSGKDAAYVVLEADSDPFVLEFNMLSDTEIEIIEFETEQEARAAKSELLTSLYKQYLADENDIKNGSATITSKNEFMEANKQYEKMTFDERKSISLDPASLSFGMLHNKPISDALLKKIAYERKMFALSEKAKKNSKKDKILGEFNSDGTYNPDALFFVYVHFSGDKEELDAKDFARKYGFIFKKENRIEKQNVTADDIRFYRTKLNAYSNLDERHLQYSLMKFERSNDYRNKFISKYGSIKESFRCVYCGKDDLTKEEIEIDHIIPVAKMKYNRNVRDAAKLSGIEETNDINNLVPACTCCNRKKGAKMGPWVLQGKLGRYESFWLLISIIRLLFVPAMLAISAFLFDKAINGHMALLTPYGFVVYAFTLLALAFAGKYIPWERKIGEGTTERERKEYTFVIVYDTGNTLINLIRYIELIIYTISVVYAFITIFNLL